MRYILVLIASLVLVSCNGFTVKEEIYMPEYTPELSVFGLLTNNNPQEFVIVERTMQLNEDYERDKEKLVVKDAIVTITGENDTTNFIFKDNVNPLSFQDYEWDYFIKGMYIDNTHEFIALPGKTYNLRITVPDGRTVTAQTTLPELPEIYVPQDFSRIKRSDLKKISIKWQDNGSAVAYSISFLLKINAHMDNGIYVPARWINIYSDGDDLYYNSPASLKYIDDEFLNVESPMISDTAMIRVEAIDRMLYDYASKNELAAMVGSDFNLVNGGVGVFGSICVDSVKIILK